LFLWICWVLADGQVKRFARLKEPKIWRQFGFPPAPKFLSIRATDRDTEPTRHLGQWLKFDGAKYMIERNPAFARIWSACRFFEISMAVAILIFLGISIWALMPHLYNANI
jgi:hypothetical protein